MIITVRALGKLGGWILLRGLGVPVKGSIGATTRAIIRI